MPSQSSSSHRPKRDSSSVRITSVIAIVAVSTASGSRAGRRQARRGCASRRSRGERADGARPAAASNLVGQCGRCVAVAGEQGDEPGSEVADGVELGRGAVVAAGVAVAFEQRVEGWATVVNVSGGNAKLAMATPACRATIVSWPNRTLTPYRTRRYRHDPINTMTHPT